MKFWKFAFEHTNRVKDAIRLIQFARAGCNDGPTHQSEEFRIKYSGRDLMISLRRGTTDIGTFAEVFHEEIYLFPELFKPKVIIDIGANIGIASLYFSLTYPESQIYSFEPSTENIKSFNKNIAENNRNNVTLMPYGLGGEDAELPLYQPNEGAFWGCSIYGSDLSKLVETVKIRSALSAFNELNIGDIDLLKIDCEGAEVDLLKSLGRENLSKIKVLIGELHPEVSNSYEALLLLSETHFVDCRKGYGDKCMHFIAVSRDLAFQELRQELRIPLFVNS
jgi:FkbM family methyltransferase